MPKKPQSGAQTAAQQQGSFLDSMPKKPQVKATNHAHAAGGKGVAWDVEDPSQGHREGLDWDNYVATSVERNTYEFNLFLVGSAVWLSVLSLGKTRQDKKRHWELKEGLAPFTPRIDPVLQRLRERCAHLLPCGKTNTDASRNKKRWFQSRAETAAHQQRNFLGLDAKGAKGKYELDGSEAGHCCNDKGHGVAVPASEPANAAHRPLLTLGLKD
ncbi:hypothetical protein NQZ68_040767 [Dissostichus eleginoides]|nr:hypothetical protein NQZ68_040767 [Dissostichus eleginoides]